jgi:hypothetical protein
MEANVHSYQSVLVFSFAAAAATIHKDPLRNAAVGRQHNMITEHIMSTAGGRVVRDRRATSRYIYPYP